MESLVYNNTQQVCSYQHMPVQNFKSKY